MDPDVSVDATHDVPGYLRAGGAIDEDTGLHVVDDIVGDHYAAAGGPEHYALTANRAAVGNRYRPAIALGNTVSRHLSDGTIGEEDSKLIDSGAGSDPSDGVATDGGVLARSVDENSVPAETVDAVALHGNGI